MKKGQAATLQKLPLVRGHWSGTHFVNEVRSPFPPFFKRGIKNSENEFNWGNRKFCIKIRVINLWGGGHFNEERLLKKVEKTCVNLLESVWKFFIGCIEHFH